MIESDHDINELFLYLLLTVNIKDTINYSEFSNKIKALNFIP